MKRKSVAEAGLNFTNTVREAELEAIEVARRGAPVVAIVPIEEYRRLKRLARPFKARLEEWVAENTPTPGHEFKRVR
jgi:prevent-host-death family protein